MNLFHLRYFVTLAHLEHYTKAAEILAITQPSLSHAISSLETEIGVKLFEKEGRNIVLTKYGKAFLVDVENSLKLLDSSVNKLKLTSSGSGTIDVALIRRFSTQLVPTYVKGFLSEHPEKDIKFRFFNDSGMTADILKGLKEKKYDIAFCSHVDNEPSISFIPVSKQRLVLAVPLAHPLASKDSATLDEIVQYPQVYFSKRSALRPIVDELFENHLDQLDIAYEIDEDQGVAGMVAQDFGIAILPKMPLLKTLNVKILTIDAEYTERYYYMAILKDVYHAPVVEYFKNYIIHNASL